MSTAKRYQETHVMTASPMQLILMLYDECVQSLDRAEKALDIQGPDRIEMINKHLLHAEDIITELSVSLDMEKGGAIANNLHKLYDFMLFHLSQANLKKELKPIIEVRKMMIDLREAWQKVADQEPGQEESAQPSNSRTAILMNG